MAILSLWGFLFLWVGADLPPWGRRCRQFMKRLLPFLSSCFHRLYLIQVSQISSLFCVWVKKLNRMSVVYLLHSMSVIPWIDWGCVTHVVPLFLKCGCCAISHLLQVFVSGNHEQLSDVNWSVLVWSICQACLCTVCSMFTYSNAGWDKKQDLTSVSWLLCRALNIFLTRLFFTVRVACLSPRDVSFWRRVVPPSYCKHWFPCWSLLGSTVGLTQFR